MPCGQGDRVEGLADPPLRLLAPRGDPEPLERLGEDPPDVLARVERAVGVLEDVLDGAGGRAALGTGAADERALPDQHLTGVGSVDAREHAGDRGLPRSRATHQPVGPTAPDGEAHVPGGVHLDAAPCPIAQAVGPGQPLDPHVGRSLVGPFPPSRTARPRHGVQQAPGVGGVRGEDDTRGRSLLEDPTVAEHEDPVAAVRGDGEIVRDQHDRHLRGVDDLVQEVQHALLDLDVQPAGRLVGDDHAGAADQRDRDEHALALAAGELVRVRVVHALRVLDPHLLQQLDRALLTVQLLDLRLGVPDALGDLPSDAHDGVQRDVRILGDVGDPSSAQPGPGGLVDPVGALLGDHAVDGDPARVGAGVRRQDPEQRLDEGRLARSGLADDREALGGVQREADVPHGVHGLRSAAAGGGQVVDVERVDLEDRGVGHGHRALSTNLPTRLAESTTSAMTAPGMRASHGAVER